MSGVRRVQTRRVASVQLERHPNAPRRQPWRAWAAEQGETGPIAVDLFSGAGGLSLGLEAAGYSVILAVDHDPASVATHLGNFAGASMDMDLSDPDRVEDLLGLLEGLDIDLIAGGPPCQPFSRAGRSKIRDLVDRGMRAPLDPRRDLWRVFLRVVEAVRPRSVLMENVPDMALGDDMRSVRFMADRLEAIGYDTDMRILEAWRFGVPQHRQRLLFVGLRDGFVTWPAERDQVTLRDAIGDLPRLRGTTGKPVARYAGPKNDFQRAARQDVANEDEDLIHDHVTRPVRPDDLEAFKLMTPQTRYSDLPDQLKRYREDIFNDKYHRLDWDSWCRSITAHIAKDGYSYIHPSEHRTLTVREAARIQTFPDSFRFSGSRSDAFRLIGNAVPPRLGHVVASEVLAAQVRGPAETGHGLSEGREKVRKRLIGWASDSTAPAWRRVGQPWDVLIGTLAGRRSPELADHILNSLPKITSATPSRISKLVDRATSEREAEILWTLLEVARAVKRSGWESGDWTCAPGLGDADVRWVETLGLGVKHVVATTGTLRIAGRLTGHPESSGVARRILLGQVVGYGDSSALITSALAGLAEENCGPSRPRCAVCPIADLCESADMAVSK